MDSHYTHRALSARPCRICWIHISPWSTAIITSQQTLCARKDCILRVVTKQSVYPLCSCIPGSVAPLFGCYTKSARSSRPLALSFPSPSPLFCRTRQTHGCPVVVSAVIILLIGYCRQAHEFTGVEIRGAHVLCHTLLWHCLFLWPAKEHLIHARYMLINTCLIWIDLN